MPKELASFTILVSEFCMALRTTYLLGIFKSRNNGEGRWGRWKPSRASSTNRHCKKFGVRFGASFSEIALIRLLLIHVSRSSVRRKSAGYIEVMSSLISACFRWPDAVTAPASYSFAVRSVASVGSNWLSLITLRVRLDKCKSASSVSVDGLADIAG